MFDVTLVVASVLHAEVGRKEGKKKGLSTLIDGEPCVSAVSANLVGVGRTLTCV